MTEDKDSEIKELKEQLDKEKNNATTTGWGVASIILGTILYAQNTGECRPFCNDFLALLSYVLTLVGIGLFFHNR
jgi:multisubunit Na+/H+ antiporter MnhG subunit